MLKEKKIYLEEASCLRASTSPMRVAVVQPLGEFKLTEEKGLHYAEGHIADMCVRADEFFRIVIETDSELAIAPEFFLPIQEMEKIICNTDMLRKGTIYVLPMEMLKLYVFKKLINTLRDDSTWRVEIAEFDEQEEENSWVNAALIIYIHDDQKNVFIQLKTKPSRAEVEHMICGKEIFSIEGRQGVLSVAMCADINPPIRRNIWSEIASTKPFSYVVHCQCNPKPDFEEYSTEFYSSLLNAEEGESCLILSVNWCRGTRIISVDKNIAVSRQSNRFLRGRTMQKGSTYRKRSLTGLHLQQRTESCNKSKKWEGWHCVIRSDNIRIIEFVRSHHGVRIPQQDFTKGIRSSFTCIWDESQRKYIKRLPQNLAIEYFEKLKAEDLDNNIIKRFFAGLSLCELEIFNSSCNFREADSWLEENIDARAPTAFLLCNHPLGECTEKCPQIGATCNKRRQYWNDETINVVLCLEALDKLQKHKEYSDIEINVTKAYPSNFWNNSLEMPCWVFHGKGWNAKKVSKIVRSILESSKTRNHIKKLDIFPNGVQGKISVNDILESPSQDIFDAEPRFLHDAFEAQQLPFLNIL
jgi:hypothetical protein